MIQNNFSISVYFNELLLAVVVWRLWGGTTDHHLHTSTTVTQHRHYRHIRLETVFEFSSWSTFNFVDIVPQSQQLWSVMLLCGLVPQTWWRKYCQSKHMSGQPTDGSESDGSNHRNYWPAPYLNLQTQGGGGDHLTSGDLAGEISIGYI